jgi:hypothetical protein
MVAPVEQVVELRMSAGRWSAILGLSIVLMAIAAFNFQDSKWIFRGLLLLCGVLGGVTSLAALFSKRMMLRLSPAGFQFGTLRKKYSYRWSDVVQFGVVHMVGKRVCFTFHPSFRGEEKVRKINRPAGFDRFLPDDYGMQPLKLAELLEQWRTQHSSNDFL